MAFVNGLWLAHCRPPSTGHVHLEIKLSVTMPTLYAKQSCNVIGVSLATKCNQWLPQQYRISPWQLIIVYSHVHAVC